MTNLFVIKQPIYYAAKINPKIPKIIIAILQAPKVGKRILYNKQIISIMIRICPNVFIFLPFRYQ